MVIRRLNKLSLATELKIFALLKHFYELTELWIRLWKSMHKTIGKKFGTHCILALIMFLIKMEVNMFEFYEQTTKLKFL